MGIDVTERRRLRLRLQMRRAGLTAPDVASVLGVQPQTVRLYMCGLRRLPPENYTKFLNYLQSRAAA